MRAIILHAAMLSGCGFVSGAEMWELPPILYSKTPASGDIAALMASIEHGDTQLPEGDEKAILRFLLKTLGIPETSQILVYSKTSAQNFFISPTTPRAIYFNENAYVGHVLGGGFEIITHDDKLGAAFHFIEPTPGNRNLQIERNTTSCLNCHATRRTEGIPGLTIRSVPTDADGNLLLPLGSTRTNHTTPLPQRWGGYYVTGSSSLPHLGNRTYTLAGGLEQEQKPAPLKSVAGMVDASRYLADTSDIVALMILEHQCHMHNLLISAAMEYRMATFEDTSTGGNRAAEVAIKKAPAIVDTMLFKGEAAIGDGGIDGAESFQASFSGRFPKTANDESLADFHLGNRVFKNRCSYMIYSRAFRSLPLVVKKAVFKELQKRLISGDACGWIPEIERGRILNILHETVPGFEP